MIKMIRMSLLAALLTVAGCSPTASPESAQSDMPVGGVPIEVQSVQVMIGQGSPIPVTVEIGGSWPHLCAQLEHISLERDAAEFSLTLLAGERPADCPEDRLGLPFAFAFPLNMVDMAPGAYSVNVNGIATTFDWQTGAANGQPASSSVAVPVQIESVQLSVGQGSPIPVTVETSGSWPHLCAQLQRASLQRDGNLFSLTLLAGEKPADCPDDPAGLPFALAYPLNLVEVPPGGYRVSANGMSIDFEWDPAQTALPVEQPFPTLAFLGLDGNVWFSPSAIGGPVQLTDDASDGNGGQSEMISYYFPNISDDGEWIAYRRDQGTPIDSGYQFASELVVRNTETGEVRSILDQASGGFDWRPGTHTLAYAPPVPEGYFGERGAAPDSSLVGDVMAYDADLDQSTSLIAPERGYALYSLHWSADGGLLGFDEVYTYEGRGWFGYFMLDSGKYVAWEEAIGNYSFAPDNSQIVYDTLTYTATGTEDLFMRPLPNGGAQQLTRFDSETGYAYWPVFSPDGRRIAYLAGLAGLESPMSTLHIYDVNTGESAQLGEFESVQNPTWSPDGAWIFFSAGPWPDQQLTAVHVSDGEVRQLGPGTSLDVAGG